MLVCLFDIASGSSGQYKTVATFLLGCYNGLRFRFDAWWDAGTVRGVSVVAVSKGFNVLIRYGKNERPLATFRGNVGTFKSIQTVLNYLQSIGIGRFEVEVANYHPQESIIT